MPLSNCLPILLLHCNFLKDINLMWHSISQLLSKKIKKIDPILFFLKWTKLGVVAHACFPSTWEAKAGAFKFQASLKHIVRTLTPKTQIKIRHIFVYLVDSSWIYMKVLKTPNETFGVNSAISQGVRIMLGHLPIYSGLILFS